MPCLLTDQNLANKFWKGSPKEHFYEIIWKSDKWFQRRRILKNFSEVHTVKIASPRPQQPCFSMDQNFANNFWKGSHKEQNCEIIPNSDLRFQRFFFRISSCPYSAKCSHSPEPCLYMDRTFTNNFWKGSHKENSCEIISKFDKRFQRRKFFNPFPNKPWFLRVCSTSLLKTLWEKEKLLVTSNFSFSHNVFYPFRVPVIFIKFEIVAWKLISLEESKVRRLGKG